MPDASMDESFVPAWSASEDGLLLREFAHRTGNEVASALAAIHLHRRTRAPRAGDRLLDDAIERLENFGRLNRMLAEPVRGRVDLAASIEPLVSGLVGGRGGLAASRIVLSLPSIIVDAAVARRMALIAAELVSNAIAHALSDRAGLLSVSMACDGDLVELRVGDDGPGIRTPSKVCGTGWGRGLVLELASRAGGSVDTATSERGTIVTVRLPTVSATLEEDEGPY